MDFRNGFAEISKSIKKTHLQNPLRLNLTKTRMPLKSGREQNPVAMHYAICLCRLHLHSTFMDENVFHT